MGLFKKKAPSPTKKGPNYTPPSNISVDSDDDEVMVVNSPGGGQGVDGANGNKQEAGIKKKKKRNKPRDNTAAAASSYASMKAARERTMIEKGPYYIHALGFVGGVAMIVYTIIDWVNYGFRDVTHTLIAVYTVLLGLVISILEEELFVPDRIGGTTRNILHRNVNMLQYVWGRGILFFCSGSLQFSQMTFFSNISGGFMMVLGLVALYHGREAKVKLYDLRESIADESQLRLIFDENDSSDGGYLEPGDFSNLADQIGLELAKGSEEDAFSCIDTDRDGKISFDEFKNWWLSYKSSYKSDVAETNIV